MIMNQPGRECQGMVGWSPRAVTSIGPPPLSDHFVQEEVNLFPPLKAFFVTMCVLTQDHNNIAVN